MLKKCPHSYYLSWPWAEIWIESLDPDCNLILVVGYKSESPVIAFFLGSKTTNRHKFFKYRQVAVNQTLIPDVDIIWIEYNSILISPEITITLESILDLLPIGPWDEFRIIRCSSIYQPNLILNDHLIKKYDFNLERCESFYVDLNKVRRNNNDYLALLSQNRRQQIRRSIKEYEKMGEIRVDIAQSPEEALNLFEELTHIHQKSWTERGHPGALRGSYIINFHKNLISRRFMHREIQLIKVSAGDYTIGCIYNLISDGNVFFYTCGFNYLTGNVYRPGLVCHYYAITHNARMGLSSYDFLEGEDSYRKTLSTDYNEMDTIIVKKKSMKYKIENVLLNLYRLYKRS